MSEDGTGVLLIRAMFIASGTCRKGEIYTKTVIIVRTTKLMKSRNVTFSLILILAVLAVAVLKWRQEPKKQEAFDRRPGRLVYAPNALCQMECRQISKEDIGEVMKKGIIHFNWSNRRAQPCPTFALQGRTRDKQYIRVSFAQCVEQTTVMWCLDLEKTIECPCFGKEP